MRPAGQTEATRLAKAKGGRPQGPRKFPRISVPEVPASLGEHGQAAWVELWQAGSWLNLATDRHAMTILCQNLDEREIWRKEVAENPMVEGSMRQMQPNKAAAQLRALEASIRDWLVKLGFFANRNGEEDGNDLDDFLSGGLPS